MARTMLSVFSPQQRAVDSPAAAETLSAKPAAHESAEPKVAAASRVVTKLGKTLVFKGDLSVDEEVLLLGTVEGSFECNGPLTVGVGGTVVGDVRGQSLTIKGAVRGNIKGTESIVIVPGATVTGDVIAPRVTIVEGAQFNGSVKMMATADSANDASALPSQAGAALTAEAVEKLLGVLSSRMK
jgi:cytoskeletal protein CcmA (bactofilin family)